MRYHFSPDIFIPFQEAVTSEESGKFWRDGERVVRATGICRFEDGVGYMMRLHHSLPNRAWESDLQRMTQEDVRVLRSLVGLQSKELEEKNSNLDALIQNIPGGVICCRDDEDLELIILQRRFF